MKFSLLIVTFLFLLSCERNFNSVDLNDRRIISLSIGNKYLYHQYSLAGDSVAVVVDWYSHKEIIADTIIFGRRYFNFNNEELLRLEGKKVLAFSKNGDIVKYDFEVEIGDTVDFQGDNLIVSEVSKEPILGDIQKVFRLTNVDFKPDTVISVSYSTKFGLNSISRRYSNSSSGKHLVGAIISSQKYGRWW